MFPAYDRDSPPRRIASPDEENDFSGRFGSFASRSKKKCENKEQRRRERQEKKIKEKAKRKKELERERMLSQHSIKIVSINSDDESDIEVPMDTVPIVSMKQKRKSKHSSKKRDADDPLPHHHLIHRPIHREIASVRVQAKINIRDLQPRKYFVHDSADPKSLLNLFIPLKRLPTKMA
ncbi:hypothetical protein LOAG_16866 [Loa loa]|uniref:Uncharacterized protein n=1 Tax=Loa loa TaxID=7209 RepID=A0A1S0UKM0_LOALO|nr:hypothetical protein LOAG_16866 [Loa loa]EJD76129.1 hypothetical protein LOAG_16866 [Loa loa]